MKINIFINIYTLISYSRYTDIQEKELDTYIDLYKVDENFLAIHGSELEKWSFGIDKRCLYFRQKIKYFFDCLDAFTINIFPLEVMNPKIKFILEHISTRPIVWTDLNIPASENLNLVFTYHHKNINNAEVFYVSRFNRKNYFSYFSNSIGFDFILLTILDRMKPPNYKEKSLVSISLRCITCFNLPTNSIPLELKEIQEYIRLKNKIQILEFIDGRTMCYPIQRICEKCNSFFKQTAR